MLIDNVQRLLHCGLMFTLHKVPSLRTALMQLIEHIQSTRLNGVYLQRLLEQINTTIGLITTKRTSLANQLNTLLQKMKSKDKAERNTLGANYHRCLVTLLKLADRAKLHTFVDRVVIDETVPSPLLKLDAERIIHDHRSLFGHSSHDCCNPLHSLLVFLGEQSTASATDIDAFIQYLRHFAQLGLVDRPPFLYLLSQFHRFKDKDAFDSQFLLHVLEQMRNVNYTKVYSHLNLPDLDHFLRTLMRDGKSTAFISGCSTLICRCTDAWSMLVPTRSIQPSMPICPYH